MIVLNKIYCLDCLKGLKRIPDNSIDLVLTDPPYGYSFMGKDWDKAVPSIDVWKECLRALKPGAFLFVMSAPRQDVLSQMVVRIGQAGFKTNFTSIYWAYASGFPKAGNISKIVDKKLGAKRKVIGQKQYERTPYKADGTISQAGDPNPMDWGNATGQSRTLITAPSSSEAKALNGSYAGFQPKPAVEIIIVAMKPLDAKTFVEQALQNKKGITWLDNCRIPYESEKDKEGARFGTQTDIKGSSYGKNRPSNGDILAKNVLSSSQGRFPANLLVSDDVLNDGTKQRTDYARGSVKKYNASSYQISYKGNRGFAGEIPTSFSRYFNLDKWAVSKGIKDTFPFLIVPKASTTEKNKGCEDLPLKELFTKGHGNQEEDDVTKRFRSMTKNFHPTVKPLKLMNYLITLASREGDVVLDPFIGSGTTAIASRILSRKFIGFEINQEYVQIARNRLKHYTAQTKLEETLENKQ